MKNVSSQQAFKQFNDIYQGSCNKMDTFDFDTDSYEDSDSSDDRLYDNMPQSISQLTNKEEEYLVFKH